MEESTFSDGNSGSNPGTNEYKVGNRKPPLHTRFSSTNQPDPAKQKETKARKKYDRQRIQELMNVPFVFPAGSKLREQLVQQYGEKRVRRMTGMEIAALQQINKAIFKGDTQAFKELNNQAFGLPKQITELQGVGGSDLFENQSDGDLKLLLQQTLNKIDDK